MPSVTHLLGKLRIPWPFPPTATRAKMGHDREPPLAFGEILAASAYLDFGGLPLEFWPGYRSAAKADDADRR